MRKTTGLLLALLGFFMGAVFGFLIAPAKSGMSIGNHQNINNYPCNTKPSEYEEGNPE